MREWRVCWLGAWVLLVLGGCAGGASAPAEDDAGGAFVPGDGVQDASMGVEDASPQEPDAVVVEEEPDDDPCGVCCPGDRRCFSDLVVEVCKQDGSGFESMSCPEGEVCSGGACEEPEFTCRPGDGTCIDLQTVEVCDATGRGLTRMVCANGYCRDGACRSGGLTGAACTANDDCAGGVCLCDEEGGCPEPFVPAFGQGYCTLSDCADRGCPAGEVCVDFGSFEGLSDGRHCVKDCTSCDAPGLTCRTMPAVADGALAWEAACFAEYPVDIGEPCEADADCLGGTCWQDELGPNDGLGYCTLAECGAERACPEGSSCVFFAEAEGHFCARNCGNGNPGSGGCPIMDRGLAVSCQTKAEVDTERIRNVCAPRL